MVKSHGASTAEIQSYIDNLRTLFHQETEEKYNYHLKELRKKWSQPFLQYFMTEIHKKVTFMYQYLEIKLIALILCA